jgi:hypothetical protein
MPLQIELVSIGWRENYKPDAPEAILELKVIAQQRETPLRHDNKVITRRQKRLGAGTSGNREARKPKIKKTQKSIDTLSPF